MKKWVLVVHLLGGSLGLGGDEEDVFETRYRTVDVYGDVKKEYVDVNEIWEDRETEIIRYFNELINAAREKVHVDLESYANTFKNFMEKEFEVKFKEIITDLQAKTADKAKIEKLAAEARDKLARINEFKEKLDKVLAL